MSKYALIVDDSRVARMALRKQLLAHNWTVEECDSAEQAIAWLHAHDDKPNVIFMDVMMTGMDGLTATRKITGNPLFAAIPIVICTGNEREIDQQNAFKSGAMDVMTKPPQADKVEALLNRLSDTTILSPDQRQPEPEPVTETVDTATMIDDVVETVTHDLQAKWHEQAQQTAEKTAKAVCEQYEQLYLEQIRQQIEAIQTTLTQQIHDIVAKQWAKEKQQGLTTVEHKVRNVMDEVLSDIDVMQQVKHDIGVQTGPWLEQQQRQLQVELGMKIGPQVTAAVDDYLNSCLTTMVTPLVAAQVDKLWAEQQATVKTDIEPEPRQNKITALSDRVSRLQQGLVVLTIGLVSMLAVVVYLS